jgi:hypothetical protein
VSDEIAISTATPMFSGSSNPMELVTIPPYHTVGWQSKMVAAKPKVLTSQFVDKIEIPLPVWYDSIVSIVPFSGVTINFGPRGKILQWAPPL